MANQVIEARNIKLGVHAKDWEDSMRQSGQLLVDSRFITEEYIDMTVECVKENGPYIVITPGVALSHSRPHTSVLNTGISLITLDESICFDSENDPVDIVLTLAATDDSAHLDKLQVLAEFLSDDENIIALKNQTKPEEVAKMLNNFKVEE